jgi:hypothetical protein
MRGGCGSVARRATQDVAPAHGDDGKYTEDKGSEESECLFVDVEWELLREWSERGRQVGKNRVNPQAESLEMNGEVIGNVIQVNCALLAQGGLGEGRGQ